MFMIILKQMMLVRKKMAEAITPMDSGRRALGMINIRKDFM